MQANGVLEGHNVDGSTLRAFLVHLGVITPRSEEEPGAPSPPRWVDAPTLRLDNLGRRAARAELARAG